MEGAIEMPDERPAWIGSNRSARIVAERGPRDNRA
jgi:hypothetical protein